MFALSMVKARSASQVYDEVTAEPLIKRSTVGAQGRKINSNVSFTAKEAGIGEEASVTVTVYAASAVNLVAS